MKATIQKKSLKAVEQKSFQCQIPENKTPVKPLVHFSPKSSNASQGYYAGGPQKSDTFKGFDQTSRVLTSRGSIRAGLRIKNSQKFPSSPHLGGLLRSDTVSPKTRKFQMNADNFEESMALLLAKLRDLQIFHHQEVSTLKVIIASLKRKYYQNPNDSQKDTQTSMTSTPRKQETDQLVRLRRENQKLSAAQTKILEEMNHLEKVRTFQRQMLNIECSKLRMEVSTLKIKLLKLNDPPEICNAPKICHLFSYPQNDPNKNQIPERISQIESKFEISHARTIDQMDNQYFTKCEKLNSGFSGIKVHYSNCQSNLKFKKPESLSRLELISSQNSSIASELSLLGIDSKEHSTDPCDNI